MLGLAIFILAIMGGRGKDLTFNERTTVHGHIKNYDMNQFKHGGRFLTRKDCLEYGVKLSEEYIKYKEVCARNEAFAKSEWKTSRRVAGQDFLANRKGRCGRPTMSVATRNYF